MVQGMDHEPCHKPLWLSEHFPPVTAYTRRTFMTIGIALNARRVGWGDPTMGLSLFPKTTHARRPVAKLGKTLLFRRVEAP